MEFFHIPYRFLLYIPLPTLQFHIKGYSSSYYTTDPRLVILAKYASFSEGVISNEDSGVLIRYIYLQILGI
jgi:hypothetical protein